jgi:hypothetical protein
MRLVLKPHPDMPSAALTRVEVDIVRPRVGPVTLSYGLAGRIDGLLLAPLAEPTRADELWQHTCFEAFIRTEVDAGYYEFNFSPSTQWAAYRLAGYRSGLRPAVIYPPRIEARAEPETYRVQVALALDNLPDLPRAAPWRLGLSAMIEETSGRKSYWALAHPPGKPDFHHADCFALELP